MYNRNDKRGKNRRIHKGPYKSYRLWCIPINRFLHSPKYLLRTRPNDLLSLPDKWFPTPPLGHPSLLPCTFLDDSMCITRDTHSNGPPPLTPRKTVGFTGLIPFVVFPPFVKGTCISGSSTHVTLYHWRGTGVTVFSLTHTEYYEDLGTNPYQRFSDN